MKRKSIVTIIVIVAVLALAAVIFATCSGRKELRVNTAQVTTSTIEETVMATGYIQPVEKVEVGTQVSGVIEKIYVDFNSFVKKGQLLAELDKLTLNEKLTQANASLTSTQSDLTYAQQNYDRTKLLYESKAATQVSMEDAVNRLAQAQTNVQNARANLHQAQVNLGYANIYSPIDGVVLDRTVSEGQTVAASFNTPTLFTIAEDLTKMQVEADVDEADIGRVREGQHVTFTVDAFNDDIFTGTVNQIRLQPTVTNNVVTYTVIIEAPNPDEKLYPGMTASVTIVTSSVTGLSVPVSAMNFRVDENVAKKFEIVGDPSTQTARNGTSATVWVKNGETLEQRNIGIGMNDGVDVLVNSGLNEGDTVVLSASYEKRADNNGKAASNPLMPGRPGGRR